jgi:hypothetical protein
MDAEKSNKPWWRERRWRLALALWLTSPILYPLSEGPVLYGHFRGWWPSPARLYAPVDSVQGSVQNDCPAAIGRPFMDYLCWWAELAYTHNQAAQTNDALEL